MSVSPLAASRAQSAAPAARQLGREEHSVDQPDRGAAGLRALQRRRGSAGVADDEQAAASSCRLRTADAQLAASQGIVGALRLEGRRRSRRNLRSCPLAFQPPSPPPPPRQQLTN